MAVIVYYSNDLLESWRKKAIALASMTPGASIPTIAEHNAMVGGLAMALEAVSDPSKFAFLRSCPRSIYGTTDPCKRFSSLLGVFSWSGSTPGAQMVQIQQKNMGEAVAAMLVSLGTRLTVTEGGSAYKPLPGDTKLIVSGEYEGAVVPYAGGTVSLVRSLYGDIQAVMDAAITMQTRIFPLVTGATISAVLTGPEIDYNDAIVSLAKQYEDVYLRGRKVAQYAMVAAGVGVGYLLLREVVLAAIKR